MSINIAVVGHGYVGRAVDLGFDHRINPNIRKHIIDPQYQFNIDQFPSYYKSVSELTGQQIDVAFVCVPTPFGDNGAVDGSIVEEVVNELIGIENCLIVIKSTVTPDIVTALHEKCDRVIYNPEFLTEKNALHDFVNLPMHIFGGVGIHCDALWRVYEEYSQCIKGVPHYVVSPAEASFIKYGINSFLASKVLWMNQFKEITDKHDVDFEAIISGMMGDPRIGNSHMRVPGPDGRKGFGGACFPKDTNALVQFGGGFKILEDVINYNNEYRREYELDDREKLQKVNYG